MILKCYAIHDNAINEFVQPFYVVNLNVAIRSLRHAVGDENHDFHRTPADFTLFELGTFDSCSGVHTLLPTPSRVCSVQEIAEAGHDPGSLPRVGQVVMRPATHPEALPVNEVNSAVAEG